jgi:hypothetical protein
MGTRPRIIAATLLSPTDKYWPHCQQQAQAWADEHVVVTDDKGEAWGDESTWREKLWLQALAACRQDDWIFILDSDFVLTFDPHILTLTDTSTAWRFPLYDLWDTTHYRSDSLWYGHNAPRYWMFRATASPDPPQYGPRGIHTGHAPAGFPYIGGVQPPTGYAILHLGWLDKDTRQEKYDRYKSVWDRLGEGERKHVESILDDRPNLEDLPPDWEKYLCNL